MATEDEKEAIAVRWFLSTHQVTEGDLLELNTDYGKKRALREYLAVGGKFPESAEDCFMCGALADADHRWWCPAGT